MHFFKEVHTNQGWLSLGLSSLPHIFWAHSEMVYLSRAPAHFAALFPFFLPLVDWMAC